MFKIDDHVMVVDTAHEFNGRSGWVYKVRDEPLWVDPTWDLRIIFDDQDIYGFWDHEVTNI